MTRTVSDQMPCYDVNSSVFFKLKYFLDATMCTNSVLVHESFMSDGPYRMREDKQDLFHFNHL